MPQLAKCDGLERAIRLPDADTISPVDAVRFKVIRALCVTSTPISFLAFSNRLVNEGTLSDEQFDQHHKEISRLYHEWDTAYSTTRSQLEGCQLDRAAEGLKTAVKSIVTSVCHNDLPLPVMISI